jgi:hypothetical protein
MRVLLLHPHDDFDSLSTDQPWDTVVDLGRAPDSFYQEQSNLLGCSVNSIFDLAFEVEDLKSWRPLFKCGLGIVVDHLGIDWWDVISCLLQPEMQDIRLALRLAERLKGCRELSATRTSTTGEALRIHLGIPIHIIQKKSSDGLMRGILRRGRDASDLGFVQARQVVYDKYDSHYRWRSKLEAAPRRYRNSTPVVLLPTAYSNVTKTALSYARLLPEQKFLLVVARESAVASPIPANVITAKLAAFATKRKNNDELEELKGKWEAMEQSLQEHPVYRLSVQTGVMRKGKDWLSRGISIRDAWQNVFETRQVTGCLSADDSNPYTRIPLLLADGRGLPAVACHHGALDSRMASKNLRFSTFLAKGEMERDFLERVCEVDRARVLIGAPGSPVPKNLQGWNRDAPWLTFFTEPYEIDFWRVEAIYRQMLPPLCEAARRSGKSVVLKLHPFESLKRRRRLVSRCLGEEDRRLVMLMDAPLSSEILAKTWCAVTVESTVAFECASIGIPSFLCGWLRNAYAGYVGQYVRFGIGILLESPTDLLRLPEYMRAHDSDQTPSRLLAQEISPSTLSRILCHRNRDN